MLTSRAAARLEKPRIRRDRPSTWRSHILRWRHVVPSSTRPVRSPVAGDRLHAFGGSNRRQPRSVFPLPHRWSGLVGNACPGQRADRARALRRTCLDQDRCRRRRRALFLRSRRRQPTPGVLRRCGNRQHQRCRRRGRQIRVHGESRRCRRFDRALPTVPLGHPVQEARNRQDAEPLRTQGRNLHGPHGGRGRQGTLCVVSGRRHASRRDNARPRHGCVCRYADGSGSVSIPHPPLGCSRRRRRNRATRPVRRLGQSDDRGFGSAQRQRRLALHRPLRGDRRSTSLHLRPSGRVSSARVVSRRRHGLDRRRTSRRRAVSEHQGARGRLHPTLRRFGAVRRQRVREAHGLLDRAEWRSGRALFRGGEGFRRTSSLQLRSYLG